MTTRGSVSTGKNQMLADVAPKNPIMVEGQGPFSALLPLTNSRQSRPAPSRQSPKHYRSNTSMKVVYDCGHSQHKLVGKEHCTRTKNWTLKDHGFGQMLCFLASFQPFNQLLINSLFSSFCWSLYRHSKPPSQGCAPTSSSASSPALPMV